MMVYAQYGNNIQRKIEKQKKINQSEHFNNNNPIKMVFQKWSEYCDFLYLVCVVGPKKGGWYY